MPRDVVFLRSPTRLRSRSRAWLRPRLACVIAIGACSMVTSTAGAFCRTTTSGVPLGYDPAADGCWMQGTPLKWSAERAPYGVAAAASKQVSLADATRIADLAFKSWNDVLCAGKTLGVQAYDDGPITGVPEASDLIPPGGDASIFTGWASCSQSNACNAQSHDVIVFDDDAWPYDDPANTVALTTITFGKDDGKIFEAYTEVNTAQHQLSTADPSPAGTYNLQAVLTHEAGHFFGLAHSANTAAIMYAFYQPAAIQLTPDDVDAICAVYPQQQARSGCSCAAAGSTPPTGAIAGAWCIALIVLCARRRPSA